MHENTSTLIDTAQSETYSENEGSQERPVPSDADEDEDEDPDGEFGRDRCNRAT